MKILLSEEEIQKKVSKLGEEISRKFPDNLLLVGVLKGSFLFFADLARSLTVDPEIQFIQASSYGSEKVSSGVVRFHIDEKISFHGKHVIVVEDIIDTGLTLERILEDIKKKEPASLSVCSLLIKKDKHPQENLTLFYGFEIDDVFVVGYGLDFNEKYRSLRNIMVLDSV